MNEATKFTGIKYDDDCGFYAILNGKIVYPKDGISGMKEDALVWLVRFAQADYNNQFGNHFATAESQEETHARYMIARKLLATYEAEMKAQELMFA